MQRFHGVSVGDLSYGDILTPSLLPPGTTVGAYCSVGTGLIVWRWDHLVDRPFLHAVFYNAALGFVPRDAISLDTNNPLSIGHDVWIGDRVTILGGCRSIGNGAVLAAGAVVTSDAPAYMTVGGVPAWPIRRRFSEAETTKLEASKWWDRPLDKIIDATDLPDPFAPLPPT